MSFLSKVLFMNKGNAGNQGVVDVPIVKENLLKTNYEPYDSSTNKYGVIFSDYARGDIENKAIIHTATGFSSSSVYIFDGFTIGSEYVFSVDINGSINDTFIKVNCINYLGKAISTTDDLIGSTEASFTVVEKTKKIQVFVGTASSHTGTTTFSNLKVQAK